LLPTGFQDLQARASGISYAAWSKSSQQIASAKSVLGKSTIIIGPNTTLSFATPLSALDLTSALYSLAKQVNNVYLIYYSQQDIAWAQTNFDSLNDNSVGGLGAAANNCQTTSTCWGASTWLNIAGDGLLLIAVGVQDLNHTSGSLESHEYTHTIQMIQAPHNYASLPRWLLEGGAEWSQSAATYSGNFNKYLEERKRNTNDLLNNPSAYTPEWIATFLDVNPGTDWIYWNAFDNWRLYDVGLLATEALVALNGPETVMKLYTDVGNGQTFMDSFNTEYGIAWVDAVPILAGAITAEIANGW
jgi:hypothetical protein